MSRLARGKFESQLASPRASRGESEILGLVARRGETIPGDGLGEAIPTLGPQGASHVRLARLDSTRLVLISASGALVLLLRSFKAVPRIGISGNAPQASPRSIHLSVRLRKRMLMSTTPLKPYVTLRRLD